MTTKQERAIEIYKANADKTRKHVIELLRTELGMTDAGASTYYYNAKNAVTKGTDKAAAKPASKTEKTEPAKEKTAKKEKAAEPESKPVSSAEQFIESRNRIEQFLEELDNFEIPAFLKKDYM